MESNTERFELEKHLRNLGAQYDAHFLGNILGLSKGVYPPSTQEDVIWISGPITLGINARCDTSIWATSTDEDTSTHPQLLQGKAYNSATQKLYEGL